MEILGDWPIHVWIELWMTVCVQFRGAHYRRFGLAHHVTQKGGENPQTFHAAMTLHSLSPNSQGRASLEHWLILRSSLGYTISINLRSPEETPSLLTKDS